MLQVETRATSKLSADSEHPTCSLTSSVRQHSESSHPSGIWCPPYGAQNSELDRVAGTGGQFCLRSEAMLQSWRRAACTLIASTLLLKTTFASYMYTNPNSCSSPWKSLTCRASFPAGASLPGKPSAECVSCTAGSDCCPVHARADQMIM